MLASEKMDEAVVLYAFNIAFPVFLGIRMISTSVVNRPGVARAVL